MKSTVLSVLILAASATAAPSSSLTGRDLNWVASTAITPWDETITPDSTGQVVADYQPYLKVETGCVPFPAVGLDGSLNSGLKPSGLMDGDCSSSTGQVYARTGYTSNGQWGIMYAWYMPKNQNKDLTPSAGHRHDWQHVVVYFNDIDNAVHDDSPIGVSFLTGQDDLVYTKMPVNSDTPPAILDYTHVLVQYDRSSELDKLHVVSSTSEIGGLQPIVQWDQMPGIAQEALSSADFGSDLVVPFSDANFQTLLDGAFDMGFLA